MTAAAKAPKAPKEESKKPWKATRLDLIIPGLGSVGFVGLLGAPEGGAGNPDRFQLRTGATTKVEDDARRAIVRKLAAASCLKTLAALRSGICSWEQLRQADLDGKLLLPNLVADAVLGELLWDVDGAEGAITRTLPLMGAAVSTRLAYASRFRTLAEVTTGLGLLPAASARVADLKTLDWSKIFLAMSDLSPASRNRLREAVGAFLSKFLDDKEHPFRAEVRKAMRNKQSGNVMEKEPVVLKDLTVEEFWAIYHRLDSDMQDIMWTLAVSGMRIGEFLGCDAQSVRVRGIVKFPKGKTGSGEVVLGDEDWAIAYRALPCRIAPLPSAPLHEEHLPYDPRYIKIYKAFQAAGRAVGIAVTPHWMRHLAANLGTNEMPVLAVKQFLRHARSEMTEGYGGRRATSGCGTAISGQLRRGRPAPMLKVS